MRVSLIITTYNWKEALALALHSALRQTVLPAEIIVADDGSRPDTAHLVRTMGLASPIPLIHSWQEDQGYRLAQSRNRALARAQGEYIVLIDGDIVLHPQALADHLAAARPGFFIQGPRALLGEAVTRAAFVHGSVGIPPLARGVGNKKNCLRSTLLARLFSSERHGLGGIRLCNFAFWRQDALRVNGFNEAFVGWGREDSEFVARLMHAGMRRWNLKFHALGYHLHHAMQTRDRLDLNDDLLDQTLREKAVWCARGVDQYLL